MVELLEFSRLCECRSAHFPLFEERRSALCKGQVDMSSSVSGILIFCLCEQWFWLSYWDLEQDLSFFQTSVTFTVKLCTWIPTSTSLQQELMPSFWMLPRSFSGSWLNLSTFHSLSTTGPFATVHKCPCTNLSLSLHLCPVLAHPVLWVKIIQRSMTSINTVKR